MTFLTALAIYFGDPRDLYLKRKAEMKKLDIEALELETVACMELVEQLKLKKENRGEFKMFFVKND